MTTTEDAFDHCPNCAAVIGRSDRSDDPGERWTCGLCRVEFCHDCYTVAGPGTGDKTHECVPVPADPARFVSE